MQRLRLMYITRDPVVARIAESSGVDWIFVDLEVLGKEQRQGHLDTVISSHRVSDVAAVREALTRSRLLVRVNPMHPGSGTEIDEVIDAGADIVMLPFFHTAEEVREFTELVDGRVETCLLLETPEAVQSIDEVLQVEGIDFVHIGLNDLHLGYRQSFMFEPLADGTVDHISEILGNAGIPHGFGGIARLGDGTLPADMIIAEHKRLGSSQAILSRTFCDLRVYRDAEDVRRIFSREVSRIRTLEAELSEAPDEFFETNRREVRRVIDEIVDSQKALKSPRCEPGVDR